MIAYTGGRDFMAQLDNCFAFKEATIGRGFKQVERDVWEDEFGVRWNRSVDKDIGVVCNQQVTPESIDEYSFPDPLDPLRYEGLDDLLRTNSDKFVAVSIGFSLFERAWTLAGMENLLMAMVAEPGFVHKLLDRILEYNLAVIDKACSYDLDGMRFGDDWGQQKGVIMGPSAWREFLKPRVAQMYQHVRSRGKKVLLHSCGKVDELFPDLIEIGLDVFNPFQPEVMDIYEIKKTFGDRLSFFGGISTQETLPYGTVEQTREEVKRLLDEVGRNGGLIASPAHSIPGDARPENVMAMIEVLNSQ